MNKKIASFGDSFIFGWEMEDNEAGEKTWPALAAAELGVDHVRCSSPGVGNDRISTQVYEYYSNKQNHQDLAVINWTWTLRWDYYIFFDNWETWTTFGPNQKNPFTEGLGHEKIREIGKSWMPSFKNKLPEEKISHVKDTYDYFIKENQEYNKFRALQTISSCNHFLKHHNIKSVQTFMDFEIFDKEWHCPPHINAIQDSIEPEMRNFNGDNFLNWSRKKGFAITEPGWHPLDDAHVAAAKLWVKEYQQILNRD